MSGTDNNETAKQLILSMDTEGYEKDDIWFAYNEKLKRVVVLMNVTEFVKGSVGVELLTKEGLQELTDLLEFFYTTYYQNKVGVNVRKFSTRWMRTTGTLSLEVLHNRLKDKVVELNSSMMDKMKEYISRIKPQEDFVLQCIEELSNIMEFTEIHIPSMFSKKNSEIVLGVKIITGETLQLKRESWNRYRILSTDYSEVSKYLKPVTAEGQYRDMLMNIECGMPDLPQCGRHSIPKTPDNYKDTFF